MSNHNLHNGGPLFGQHIDTVIKAQQARGTNSDVPHVITELVSWLDAQQGTTTTNIFRALGHAPTVQHIRAEFEDGSWNAANHPREDMHSITAVLKVYLRELPDSLFPSKYYSLATKIVREVPDTWQQSYNLRACLYALPKHNRDSILHISNFLHRVANNSKENGVDASTLATILAPYFLRPPPSNPPSPDKFSIVADKEHIAGVVKRFIEDAPFFNKTATRPPSAPEGASAPSSSFVQGRALYAYPGGSKWLLALQKEDIVTILDIKNEEGWVKVSSMKGETGYTPLSYIQLVPVAPPSDDPSLRCTLPSESEFMRGEVGTPKPEVKHLSRTHITSPHLTNSPQFSSPDLSIYTSLPPPPPIDFGTDSSIPPRIDVNNLPSVNSIPSPLSPSAVSPRSLSSSAPHGIPPPLLNTISPRSHLSGALSNSVPSLPVLPTSHSMPTTSKSNSFNNSVLPPAHSDLPSPIPHHLPTKLSRAFSYSAPPPRLVAPQLPVLANLQSPESERSERSERSEHDDETEETDYETDDYDNSHEDLPVAPPPAPALPPALSLSMSSNDLDQDAVILKKRKERAEETLSTERTYVKQLTVVYDCFVEPLKRKEREKTPILNGTEIFAIFSNIEVILNCHRKLLDTMEKRMLVWDSIPELGDIFLENTAFIKLYKYYVNNFDKSIITLKACREKNPEFQKFAADLDYTEKLSMLSVESFLILPVQRIPRYVLLLQDLLKYTSPSHRDFNNLSNALSFIKDLADFINSNKSDADNINKILGIQEGLIDTPEEFTLVVPRRRYIEEGAVLYKKKKAWVYLFSDALLFTKQEKKGKRYKTLINLPTASLNITDEPGMLKIISTEGTFRFTAETPKEREHWIKSIRDTMDASRVDMLHSAFNDGNQTEGSNKQFMKLREEENAAKKKTLVDRLLENEKQYVESIQYIKNTFIAPLRKAVDSPMPMIALAELIDITSNLETLINCHVIFLQAIKDRVAEWESKPYVDDLFTEKAAFLKLYNYYVSNHHKSLETIDSCIEKHPLFAVFLRELESREKVELKVLLQEPLRRVSSYYLTVQEMSQYLKPKTEEYDAIAKVVVRLKEQTEKLNADLQHATGTHSRVKGLKGDKKDLERGKSARKFRISNNKESK